MKVLTVDNLLDLIAALSKSLVLPKLCSSGVPHVLFRGGLYSDVKIILDIDELSFSRQLRLAVSLLVHETPYALS